MDDYLPPIHITVREPSLRRFLDRMAEIAETVGAFKVERHYTFLGQVGFDVVNLRSRLKSPHRGLICQLIAHPDEKFRISVEIRAEQWSPKDPPSCDTYCAEARAMIIPLLQMYNRKYKVRYRVAIAARERSEPKLPPQCAKLFHRFAALANKSSLHPLDWRRFYQFVKNCRLRARFSEEEMTRLLVREGFSERQARYIGDIYGHLREFKRLT